MVVSVWAFQVQSCPLMPSLYLNKAHDARCPADGAHNLCPGNHVETFETIMDSALMIFDMLVRDFKSFRWLTTESPAAVPSVLQSLARRLLG